MTIGTVSVPAPSRVGIRRARYLREKMAAGTINDAELAELVAWEAKGGKRLRSVPDDVAARVNQAAGRATLDRVVTEASMRDTLREAFPAPQGGPVVDFVAPERAPVPPNPNPAPVSPATAAWFRGDAAVLPGQLDIPGAQLGAAQVQLTQPGVTPPPPAAPPQLEAKEVEQVSAAAAPQAPQAAPLPPGLIALAYNIGAAKSETLVDDLGGMSLVGRKTSEPFAVEFERGIRAHIGNGGRIDFAASVVVLGLNFLQAAVLLVLKRKGITLKGGAQLAAAPTPPTNGKRPPPPPATMEDTSVRDVFVGNANGKDAGLLS